MKTQGGQGAARRGVSSDYVRGSAVAKPRPGQVVYPAPGHIRVVQNPKAHIVRQKNRDRARYMNLGYVLFLTCALLASAFVLTTYIGLQSDITNTVKNVSKLERELNNLRLANEENYSRIVNNVDLDHIRRVAIQELGMTYAVEGQIVEFADNRSDYVRQLNSLP